MNYEWHIRVLVLEGEQRVAHFQLNYEIIGQAKMVCHPVQ